MEREAQRKLEKESKNKNDEEEKEEDSKFEGRIKAQRISRKESDLFTKDEKDMFRRKLYEDYDYSRKQEGIISKLAETFQREGGVPTKIQIYKCVVWKNTDPSLDEETIKKMIHRSGSQIFNRGGFIVKLPQKKQP